MINKKAIATLTAASLALFSGSAMADSAWNASQNPIVAANNEVGIAATGTLMNYQEHFATTGVLSSPIDDTESGWLPGFSVNLSGMNSNLIKNLYLSLNYNYSSAGIAYKGASYNPNIPNSARPLDSTDQATTQNFIGKLGKGLFLGRNMMLTPYVAGGFQLWNRQLPGTHERYHSELVGAGLMYQYAPTARLVLGADMRVLALVGGGIKTSQWSSGFGTSGEETVGIHADYKISGGWHVYGGLNFTHFTYTGTGIVTFYQGATKYIGKEPPSSTNLLGMSAGLAYSY